MSILFRNDDWMLEVFAPKCTYRSCNAAKKARLANVRVSADQQGACVGIDRW